MAALRDVRRKLREQGLRRLFADAWFVFVLLGDRYDTVNAILGDELQHQVALAPRLGYWPRIENPRTLNEKIVHRKLRTDDPRFATVEDKYAVRSYVEERVGAEYLNDLLHVTTDPATIPFDDLPEEFVVKLAHGSGYNLIVEDVSEREPAALRSRCEDWLSAEYGVKKHEYWHREIEPRVLVEPFLGDPDDGVPVDYKFLVFHGSVEYVQVDHDRFGDHTRRFYDADWTPQEFEIGRPLGPVIEEPTRFEEMKAVAERLGEEFKFVRVDLFQPNDEAVIFGEMTVGPYSGFERFRPSEYDFELGSYW